jgi:hypothetical protein
LIAPSAYISRIRTHTFKAKNLSWRRTFLCSHFPLENQLIGSIVWMPFSVAPIATGDPACMPRKFSLHSIFDEIAWILMQSIYGFGTIDWHI